MKKIIFASALLCGLLYAQGTPAVEITQEDIAIQNKISDANQKIESKSVEDFFEEFADNYGIEYGQTENGKTFYSGYGDVTKKEGSQDFSRALSIGYQRAIANIQAEFIKDAFGRIANEKIITYLQDSSSNAREFEELPKGGVISQIFDKVKQLAGAKLDKALSDLGVNVEGLTEERKKEIFRDEFISESLTQAYGNMSGLVSVQTIVTQTSNGNYRIGVIAVMSDKTRAIAQDMARNRMPSIKGKGGKPIKEYLPKEDKDYLNEYGIRLVYDENGTPVILSYGTWGFSKDASTDSRILDRLESRAKETASTNADTAIMEFVNTEITYSNKQTIGDLIQTTLKETRTADNVSLSEQSLDEIIDKSSSQIKIKSSGKLRGIRTLKRWTYEDENGVVFVGAVRAYSYANYLNTTQAITPKDSSTTSTSQKSTTKVQRSSNMVNDLDDF